MRFLPHLTIFLGSFLSFFIQPMVGRTLLPVFGGCASVWVTCLVAFQALLLVGSGYAFVPAHGRGGRRVHLTLVAVAAVVAATLPLWKADALAAASTRLSPVVGVVASVLALAGLASLVLSANATVVQSWRGGGREVYRLYVISNIGSLTGLLAYPLAVEPFVSLNAQWAAFGAAILVYGAMLAGVGGADGAHGGAPGKTLTNELIGQDGSGLPTASEPTRASALVWIALPGLSCALMTAATTFITTDFAPLPLMWAVLLAAFLLSYVIGFSRIGERLLPVWIALSVPVLLFVGWTLLPKGDNLHRFSFGLAAAILLLLVVGSALHAALCRSRPETDRLPLFYFCTALGGVLGGILAGVVAPLAFDWVAEFPLALIAACAALAWAAGGAYGDAPGKTKIIWGAFGVVVAAVGFAALLGDANGQQRIWRARGFYGAVSVRRDTVKYANGRVRELRAFYHGKTVHGTQLPDFPDKPTLYYSLNGGGIAFESYAPRKEGRPIRAGFVGMGIGTMAAYGRKGDVFRFYEISPEAIHAATDANLFTFVSNSAAKVEIVAGDARLELMRDRERGMEPFDILVIDAYSGDSVPTHLITREAFALYRSMLKPGGILALHLSNWHMNLWPIAKAAAHEFGWQILGTYSGRVLNEFAEETGWAFLTDAPFEPRMPTCCYRVDWERVEDRELLEDARGSLLRFIEFNNEPPCER